MHLNEGFERPGVALLSLICFVFMWQLLKAEPKASHPFGLLCVKRMVGFYCFAHMIQSCAPGLSRAGVVSEEAFCLFAASRQLHPYVPLCVTLIT